MKPSKNLRTIVSHGEKFDGLMRQRDISACLYFVQLSKDDFEWQLLLLFRWGRCRYSVGH
jgi:hypothetical protein